MITESREEEDWNQPMRDQYGRFIKGISGNPNGRPHKAPKRPWSLAQSLAEALDETVPVSDSGGVSQMAMRDLIVKRAVRSVANATAKQIFEILDQLDRMGALQPPDEHEESVFTEEDRRLLELVEREVLPHLAANETP